MKLKKIIPVNLLILLLFGLTLGVPAFVEAGRGHHRHSHHHHHHHHHDGYNIIYNQPRGYYNRPYYPPPQYVYNYYPVPAPMPVPVPVPVYAYPPNVMLGIEAGNASFMIRY